MGSPTIEKLSALQIDDLQLQSFKRNIHGNVIMPTDSGYNEVRQVYNGMIDKRPSLIVRCADTADIVTCVNFARENNILLAIRGGGHNAGGLGICDDGLVIDLISNESNSN